MIIQVSILFIILSWLLNYVINGYKEEINEIEISKTGIKRILKENRENFIFDEEMFVIGTKLMTTLGYSEKIARGQFTTQLRKLEDYNSLFELPEYRKAINVITIDEAIELLSKIATSDSKYRYKAKKLLTTGFDNSILTNNDEFVEPTDIKKQKRKTTKELKDEVVSIKKEIEKLQNKLKELEIN